jgi:hypothetical protein
MNLAFRLKLSNQSEVPKSAVQMFLNDKQPPGYNGAALKPGREIKL